MKTIMTLTAVALISACSNAQLYDQIIRERDARMAAIPGEVHQEYVAKFIQAKSLFSVSHTNSQIGKAKAKAMSKSHPRKQN